jgi:hypothetical protein
MSRFDKNGFWFHHVGVTGRARIDADHRRFEILDAAVA